MIRKNIDHKIILSSFISIIFFPFIVVLIILQFYQHMDYFFPLFIVTISSSLFWLMTILTLSNNYLSYNGKTLTIKAGFHKKNFETINKKITLLKLNTNESTEYQIKYKVFGTAFPYVQIGMFKLKNEKLAFCFFIGEKNETTCISIENDLILTNIKYIDLAKELHYKDI